MYNFNRPYVRDENRKFTPVYLPGETYSFYFNPDDLIDDAVPGEMNLFILDANGSQVFDLGVTNRVFINPVCYHVWKTFVFPPLPDGQYFFQLYDNFTANEKARSEVVLVVFNCVDRTCVLKFRHNDNLYNVFYNLLPDDFYQIFRLPLSQVELQYQSERTQYRQSSNGRNIRTSKSFRDQKLTIEAYWFDDESHQALSAALEHNEVFIDGYKVMNVKQITVDRQTPFSNLTKSNFEILLDEYNRQSLDIDGWGEFIAYGGDAPVFIAEDIMTP